MGRSPIISIVYLVVGVVIANNYGYLTDFGSISRVASAILAVVLWPLLILGVNLNIAF